MHSLKRDRGVVVSISVMALVIALAVWLVGHAQGERQAGGGKTPDHPDVKAPIGELLHCPLAFA